PKSFVTIPSRLRRMPFAPVILGAIWFAAQPCFATPFQWEYTGSLSTGRFAHTATLLTDGTVLVAGGNGIVATTEIYDPATGAWSVTGSLNTARYGQTATLLRDGRVLIAGGSSFLASAEVYDPATGSWSVTGSLSVGREGHTATLLPNDK